MKKQKSGVKKRKLDKTSQINDSDPHESEVSGKPHPNVSVGGY